MAFIKKMITLHSCSPGGFLLVCLHPVSSASEGWVTYPVPSSTGTLSKQSLDLIPCSLPSHFLRKPGATVAHIYGLLPRAFSLPPPKENTCRPVVSFPRFFRWLALHKPELIAHTIKKSFIHSAFFFFFFFFLLPESSLLHVSFL